MTVNNYITLQVADTKFAIKCNYPSFTSWLVEKHRGFIAQGEPHLRLNLIMDSISPAQGNGQDLSMTVTGDGYEHGELRLSIAASNPTYFFWLALQLCLRCAIASKQPPDLLLHSAGIVRGGMAYLFAGVSGSGKSTICKLLAKEPTFSILHDDAIAIAQTKEGFHAWSTPLGGEMPAKCSSDANLRAVFFLKHGQTNYAARLSGRKAAALLSLNLMPPLVAANGSLGIELVESLKLLLALAERIPCYELHFKPERGFWECIPKLFKEESTTMMRKG